MPAPSSDVVETHLNELLNPAVFSQLNSYRQLGLLLRFLAELFEQVLKQLLPLLQQRWQARQQRPMTSTSKSGQLGCSMVGCST